ncbi:uncharacterized protein UHO2_00983 [Ustilago hordei]|uniref:CCHC-type domain-containing protein n=1 Tax=Ustilago hordei TaxID=120017 RepID=I2G3X6_USTHO|nr:uncharacterized protein UHO2_00983 [Ustilago hordei]CCF53869.1 uncharacterized protein UHOR_00240 [Ustilago hordei]SYW74118.1 uncharacterized protein UHO2_00983 [Ustilago hordei]
MSDNTEMQAGASKAKGGRKGKAPQLQVPNYDATNETEVKVTNEESNPDSDQDSGSKQYNFCTLAKLLELVPKLMSQSYYSWNVHVKSFLQSVPHAMKHLEGTYNKKHPKWNHVFNDALMNAVHGTINTTGEYNINYLILDIIREHHTFHQFWKKIENGLTNEAIATSCWIALIAQLGELRMYNSDVQKLIQEIRTIQTESSLLGKLFADDTLFSILQKCTICHPVYKETVATISQLTFNALATALTIQQSAVENYPTQKIDPCQANARVAGSDNQEEPTVKDEKDQKDEDNANAKVAARPRKLQCWVCKRLGHGINQCDAMVTILENSPLAKTK